MKHEEKIQICTDLAKKIRELKFTTKGLSAEYGRTTFTYNFSKDPVFYYFYLVQNQATEELYMYSKKLGIKCLNDFWVKPEYRKKQLRS